MQRVKRLVTLTELRLALLWGFEWVPLTAVPLAFLSADQSAIDSLVGPLGIVWLADQSETGWSVGSLVS